MKEIWRAKVALIQNVEFCKAAPLGIKVCTEINSLATSMV